MPCYALVYIIVPVEITRVNNSILLAELYTTHKYKIYSFLVSDRLEKINRNTYILNGEDDT